jgi:uncharacterized protein
MQSDRTIGRTVKVKTYEALVELSPETSSYVKSSAGGLYAIGVINSFVIIPVARERVVAIVTGLDMAEEPQTTTQRQVLVIAKPRRTMWVSMIGTITQTGTSKHFEYGVRRYPELDNPVWFASEEDLDIIFEKGKSGASRVTIGKSPIFTEYDVTIDIDQFFSKHAAILGNTGAGKSCTVTALIRSVLDKMMPNAHFIIFDTNNEYERAFTNTDESKMYNTVVLRNEGDTPTGFIVPHWFMNSLDYQAFFRPSEGAQAPLLFRAIRSARTATTQEGKINDTLDTIELETNKLEKYLIDPPGGASAFFGKKNVRELVDGLRSFLAKPTTTQSASHAQFDPLLMTLRNAVATDGQLDANASDTLRQQITRLRDLVAGDRRLVITESLLGVDTPTHFDFDDFVTTIFEKEIAREAQRDQRIRTYIGTLQLRLEQARQDPRYRFLFGVQPFGYALASFLRLLFGVQPAKHFAKGRPPWADAYEAQYPGGLDKHQITIIDLSQLASEVLENVTALIGRLVLEFMQRLTHDQRGNFPVVLVLEEAHRYIPSHAPLERQQRAREVFEKIAKEGRKFGLSLLVASQRPSELSRTVLAQCNSFIVHRIQNPDDQDYFKSVISGINRELLGQLPALAQQQAIVLGDCVTLPLQVRIRNVDPRPHSDDPQFIKIWSDEHATVPDIEGVSAQWQGTG